MSLFNGLRKVGHPIPTLCKSCLKRFTFFHLPDNSLSVLDLLLSTRFSLHKQLKPMNLKGRVRECDPPPPPVQVIVRGAWRKRVGGWAVTVIKYATKSLVSEAYVSSISIFSFSRLNTKCNTLMRPRIRLANPRFFYWTFNSM